MLDAIGNKWYELEKDLEDDAVGWARRRGWYSRKYRSAGRRSAPDRIFIRDGRVLFVEFKRPGEEPIPLQFEEHTQLQAVGADVVWVDSIEDFKAVIRDRENRGPADR